MEVIFYKLEGCQACEAAKPLFEELKKEYKEFSFTEANLLQEKKELYEEHAEEEQAAEYIKDEEGNVKTNHSGKPFKKLLKNEDGKPIMTKVYAAPSFYFINPEDEEFLGKTNNPQELKSLLGQMRELLNEQN